MNKPSYFKMFDGFMDALRDCETHADRSKLLLAMFDYWENGTEPTLPKKLKDKWRFIYNSMRLSRKNAYAKLSASSSVSGEQNEQLEESSQASSMNCGLTQNANGVKSLLEHEMKTSYSQLVAENTCVDSNHDVPIYRIQNIELKNNEIENNGIKSKEQEQDSTNMLVSSPAPSFSHKTICSCVDEPAYATVNEVVNNQVLRRITELYFLERGPVAYTYKKAGEELGLGKEKFYAIIKQLESEGRLTHNSKTINSGCTISLYTPLDRTGYKLLPYFKCNEDSQRAINDYFSRVPFRYVTGLDLEDFTCNNETILQQAYEEHPDEFKSFEYLSRQLYYMSDFANSHNALLDPR